MASSGSWADFEGHKASIRHNTVAKLQIIISGWTEQCRVSIPKSGKKQDLIDRMIRVMNEWKESNQLDKWLRAKAVLDQVRENGHYSHYAMPSELGHGYNPNHPYAPPPGSHKLNGGVPYSAPSGSGSSHLRYDAYAPPRKAAPIAAASSSSPVKPVIRFKSSPFFKVDQTVSPVVECAESTSAMDRRSQSLTFTLTSDQLSKLQATNSRFQLRLFCTSSLYHSHHQTGFRTESPCPIEFPATCEVRVNNVQLAANLKGLKKKPGTAPPPDLGKAVRLTPQMPNRVEMVYVNSQQPVQHKKFYMVVYLVETTSVQQLVEKLKKGKYKGEAEIRAKMIQTASYDDDIIAGPQKMSLKCPLSYMRVETPCRSVQCPHAQCFDATSWFSMMEQTTTWLCPVCDKVLNVEELIVDGYFDRILKDTPESAEDVMVEADGEWHTSDNKHASVGWRTTHPVANCVTTKIEPPRKEPEKPVPSSSNSANPPDGRTRQEIISLDSDSDDEGIVKRELSPTSGYTTTPAQTQSQSHGSSGGRTSRQPPGPSVSKATLSNEVIDLTLDSDEDDMPLRSPPKVTAKRKEREVDTTTEPSPTWKRSRYPGPSVSSSATSAGYTNGVGGSHSSAERGMNGTSYSPTAGTSGPGSGSGGANSWGSVRIPISAPTQSTYQAPYSHAAPPTLGMPVHSQNLSSVYSNHPSPNHVRLMDMAMLNLPRPAPPPTQSASFHGGLRGHSPPR